MVAQSNIDTVIDVEYEVSEDCKEQQEQQEQSCSLKSKLPKLPKITKAKQKKVAKIGLVSSMALTAISGFVDNNYAKKIHVASGFALIGFSVWHASLYEKNKKRKTEKNCEE